jgi:hypothetical protein
MLPGFEKIIEERIRRAQERGEFENLPGAGKPLELGEDAHIAEDLKLAYKVLKNADCLPPEIELRKDIECTEDLLAAMPDTAEKYQTLKKLNYLVLKLNSTRRTSILNEMPQQYTAQVASRLERGRPRNPQRGDA